MITEDLIQARKNILKTLDNQRSSFNLSPYLTMRIVQEIVKTLKCGYIKGADEMKCMGYLLGASATENDYYYILIDNNLKIQFVSAICKIERCENPGPEYNVLDYILKTDPQSLYPRISKALSIVKDILITPIYI